MGAINGLFFFDRAIDINSRSLRKLRLLVKQMTNKNSPTTGLGFSYFASFMDRDPIQGSFKKTSQEVWDEELKEFEFSNDLNLFITKNYNFKNKRKKIEEPYIFEGIYTFILGPSSDFSENPSKIIAEKGFERALSDLRSNSPSPSLDFNVISFNQKNLNTLHLYRGILPFKVVYSFDFNCLMFTTNHTNSEIITKNDLLKFNPFLPIDLDPYSLYIVNAHSISCLDQDIDINEALCCKMLEQLIKQKKLLLNYEDRNLYHTEDQISYSFCPFCGYNLKKLMKG